MGFLEVLRVWGDDSAKRAVGTRGPSSRVSDSPGAAAPADPQAMSASPQATAYDREQWRKKLKRVLAALPRSESEWADLRQEAGSLGFGEEWLATTYCEEFALLIRKIVSDREVTADEHHNLDLARSLMGISDAEAEALFHAIVSEAEAFFGKSIQGA